MKIFLTVNQNIIVIMFARIIDNVSMVSLKLKKCLINSR